VEAPTLRDFDGLEFYAALDRKRQAQGLSWQGVADAVWDLSADLHRSRLARGKRDHPLAAETVRRLGERGTPLPARAVLPALVERTPESFLVGAAPDAGAPPPHCGPDRRPRWDLKELHAALAELRSARGLTWTATAEELHCTPGQLTGLKTACFATGRCASRSGSSDPPPTSSARSAGEPRVSRLGAVPRLPPDPPGVRLPPRRNRHSVQARGEGNADDRALGREEAGDDLAPRLLAGRVQQIVARGGELLGGGVQGGAVGDLELDADLGRRQVPGPLVLTETGVGGLGQRPDAEVPRPRDSSLWK
jgi:hypothetical protein